MPKLILCKFVPVDTNWVCSLCGNIRIKNNLNSPPKVLCNSNTRLNKKQITDVTTQQDLVAFRRERILQRHNSSTQNTPTDNVIMPQSSTAKKKHKCGGCAKKVTKAIIQKSIAKSKQTQQIKLQELRDKLDKK